jgi:PKD repeat protein
MKNIYLLFTMLFLASFSYGQTTITIGTGTQSNSNTNYPAPYGNWYQGAKHQIIITAAELNAAGMTAGDILSLAFDVDQANGTVLDDFSIKIGTTNLNQFANNSNFQTGLTQVFGPISYTETAGSNVHTFSSPYNWNGTSNLIIESCFNNAAFSNNARTFFTATVNDMVIYERQDALGVCNVTVPNTTSNLRPNIVFQWNSPSNPPVSNFNASTTSSCSGDITFFDLSSNAPTGWSWDFGDGGTSTAQNPSYTYTSSGVYTVSLTTTNAFGTDTEIKTNYININLSGNSPITPSCTPITTDGSLDFGITNVSFNTLNKTSGGGSEGYSDFTCDQTTVYAGQTYTFTADHAYPTNHNCVAWIDWNNDGIFNNTTEKIAASSSSLNTSVNVTIPSAAVLNTPLRMRVIADYDLNATPTPCANPGYGQCEDYTVFVEQLMIKPDADFEANTITTCNGQVSFTDLSTNIPYGWAWNFGDGGTSVAKNPSHTYTTDGTYTVQLIATNAYGSDTIIYNNLITVDTEKDLLDAACSPSTLGYCCGYGIYTVTMDNINKSSIDAQNGYQDYSCENNAILETAGTYNLYVRTGDQNAQDTKAWIDYNNDGIFDNTTELIFSKLNAYNPSANFTIPTTGIVLNTYLRMRVSSDELGATLDGCSNHLRGQTEDYGVYIENNLKINEHSLFNVSVYPNPTEGLFSVKSDELIKDIKVYSIIGQTIFSSNNLNAYVVNNLDLSNFTSGQYFIEITDQNGNRAIEKVILK